MNDQPYQPRRGDAVEAWIKSNRDDCSSNSVAWNVLDDLLEDYRLLADTGKYVVATGKVNQPYRSFIQPSPGDQLEQWNRDLKKE